MKRIKLVFWGTLILLSVLWLAADPYVFQQTALFPLRNKIVQYSGILATVSMSIAMILSLRPLWLEKWMGGLDKMYCLHKWLGIGGLVTIVLHWLWAVGPKWAVSLG